MLIITPVFQTPLVPGGIFKNFQIHIFIRWGDSADGFSNSSYSRQERKERQNICWQYSIFRWLVRWTHHMDIQNSDRGIWDCVCGCKTPELPRLIEICWPLSWFAASEANQITLLVSKGPLTSFYLTFLCPIYPEGLTCLFQPLNEGFLLEHMGVS